MPKLARKTSKKAASSKADSSANQQKIYQFFTKCSNGEKDPLLLPVIKTPDSVPSGNRKIDRLEKEKESVGISSDSEVDIIEPTPEKKAFPKRERSKTRLATSVAVATVHLASPDSKKVKVTEEELVLSSPDMIPPTPLHEKNGKTCRHRGFGGFSFTKLIDKTKTTSHDVGKVKNNIHAEEIKISAPTLVMKPKALRSLNLLELKSCGKSTKLDMAKKSNLENLLEKCDCKSSLVTATIEDCEKIGAITISNDEKDLKVPVGMETDVIEDDLLEDCGSQCTCAQNKLSRAEIMSEKFGRHEVKKVDCLHNGQVQLLVESVGKKLQRTCTLKGFWANTYVKAGDVVHIETSWNSNEEGTVDDEKGYIIVHPDQLLAGTSIVGSLFCFRKAVLTEWYRRLEGSSQSMLVGVLIHRLLQEVLKEGRHSLPEIQGMLDKIFHESRVTEELYGLGVDCKTIQKDLNLFLPRIQSFYEEYVLGKEPLHLSGEAQVRETRAKQGNPQWKGRIMKVCDIEETIWSPRLGIKGNIDVTVGVQIHSRDRKGRKAKILPLELKTGKSSFSAEHKGQVILYSLMMAERREDPEGGLLSYIRDGALSEVTVEHREMRGLLQMRNELAHYLATKPFCEDRDQITSLPPPISNERACSQCSFQTLCGAFYRTVDSTIMKSELISSYPALDKASQHLNEAHLAYFRHWNLLLHMEMAEGHKNKSASNIWCQPLEERLKKGQCLTPLKLQKSFHIHGETFAHTFTISCPYNAKHKVNWEISDVLIISTDDVIALATGTLKELGSNFVTVLIEKNLCGSRYELETFHLDRTEFLGTSGINFNNLASLLEDKPDTNRIRELIIDQKAPEYSSALKRDVIVHGKKILQSLNESQQRAILKALSAQDYLLIEGMPGTGKTSVIVAMVRILTQLKKSVLLTSYTHMALDNILLKLKDYEVDFVRMGKASRVHPLLQEYSAEKLTESIQDPQELESFYNKKAVIATTCLSMKHPVFRRRKFEFCILDEAGQVLQMSALAPLFCGKTFILVGDSHQLPPLVQSKSARLLGMDESLFSRLQTATNTVSLHQQYRMNQTIMDVANKLVYEGRLECGSEQVATATLKVPNWQIVKSTEAEWLQHVLTQELAQAVIFIDSSEITSQKLDDDKEGVIINSKEALITRKIVAALKQGGVKDDDIGVIAPFRAQVSLLKRMLSSDQCSCGVEVSTVDQYQGRDKDAIICSLTRSSHVTGNKVSGQSGEILNDKRRWNVAFTRAKHKLICIGDRETLKKYDFFASLLLILTPQQTITLKDGCQGFCLDKLSEENDKTDL